MATGSSNINRTPPSQPVVIVQPQAAESSGVVRAQPSSLRDAGVSRVSNPPTGVAGSPETQGVSQQTVQQATLPQTPSQGRTHYRDTCCLAVSDLHPEDVNPGGCCRHVGVLPAIASCSIPLIAGGIGVGLGAAAGINTTTGIAVAAANTIAGFCGSGVCGIIGCGNAGMCNPPEDELSSFYRTPIREFELVQNPPAYSANLRRGEISAPPPPYEPPSDPNMLHHINSLSGLPLEPPPYSQIDLFEASYSAFGHTASLSNENETNPPSPPPSYSSPMQSRTNLAFDPDESGDGNSSSIYHQRRGIVQYSPRHDTNNGENTDIDEQSDHQQTETRL